MIGRDKDGVSHCRCCGHSWPSGKVYLNWPVKLHWAWSGIVPNSRLPGDLWVSLWERFKRGFQRHSPPRCWFTWHGFEIGSLAPGQAVFAWVFHLGPVKVIFGERKLPPLNIDREEPWKRPALRIPVESEN